MKYLLLLYFGLMSIGLSAQYTPMLDDSNEWNFTTCYFGCITDPYWTDGDTLVDGNVHKILDGYHYIERKYLLREEGQKVYFTWVIDENTADEYLLYDFGLAVGDVFEMKNPLSPFPTNGGPFILDSIVERTLIDGDLYEHFYFSPHPSNTISENNAVWVEGIGSVSMVNAPGGDPDINGVGALSCFYKEGQLFYRNLDSIDECQPFLGLKDRTTVLQRLTWRQENGVLLLRGLPKGTVVDVFDLSGKTLAHELQWSDAEISIDSQHWNSGIYLLQFRDSVGQTESLKISWNSKH